MTSVKANTMLIYKCYKNALITLSGLLLLSFENVAGQEYDGDIRLRGGQGDYSGRVEIYHDRQWGTVCDDYWDINDAEVTCRQLGYQSAVGAYSGAYFGEGTGEIFLDDVQCEGNEARLENCENRGWSVHNCDHNEDAGVECLPYVNDGDIRLRDGHNSYSGRVEIYHDGQWGTVCDDYWDINDAEVTCRQLGYQSAIQAYSNAFFGEGTGEIFLDDVQCIGYETRLENCENRGWSVHNCGHHEDAGVECLPYDFETTTLQWWRNDGDVRLVEGSSANEGRVEVYYDGQWNTVCDDYWDNTDANVVCRQLGHEGSAEAFGSAYFGPGDGEILLDNVACSGWESTLLQCSSNELYEHDCSHVEDAGVRCEPTGEESGGVRLVGGTKDSEGRVEVFYNNAWGTVCDDLWLHEAGDVVCRQLGYSGADDVRLESHFGEGIGPIMYYIQCNGEEQYWSQCDYDDWNTGSCDHREDAGVTCTDSSTGVVRLRNGHSERSGRVEIYYMGQWGTICGDLFSYEDALVICRQLGFTEVKSYYSEAYYGKGDGPIMENFDCNGLEWDWRDCSYSNWDTVSCSHSQDASVVCAYADAIYDAQVRLVDGYSGRSGRVEIYHWGEWGTVCDDNFDMAAAQVVCRQLGYPGTTGYEGNAIFGEGSGPIMLDGVNCNGMERTLDQCYHNGWYKHNCDHNEDVGVFCQIPAQYVPRLVGGFNYDSGRVEVWDGNRWETLCDDDFNVNEASTICRQIGFEDYYIIYDPDQFGPGNSPRSDVRFSCGLDNDKLSDCVVLNAPPGICATVAICCQQYSEAENVLIVPIVVSSIFIFVVILVGLFVSYRHTKRTKARSSHPGNIATVSGTDNSSGPSASQLNQNNYDAPPQYYEVINNQIEQGQNSGSYPMHQSGFQPNPSQLNQGAINTSQAAPLKTQPTGFVYTYPVDTSQL